MKPPLRLALLPSISAFIAAAVMLPFWYIHLFVGSQSGLEPLQAAIAQLRFDFSSENQNRLPLLLWAITPIAWLAFGLVNLRIQVINAANAKVLFAVATSLAVASVALLGWETAFLFALPAAFSVLRLRNAQPAKS